MKQYLVMFLLMGSSFILLPVLTIKLCHIEVGHQAASSEVYREKEESADIIKEETLIGILAKEIPYTYEMEALKAQAVVERTYMARRILGIQSKGAIVGYTVEEMKALWGEEQYSSIYNRYKEAVEATLGKLILCDNKPIEALYHKASSGRTRDAKDVYKQEVSYLNGVDSSVDQISTQIQYTKAEVIQRIQEAYPSLAVEPDNIEAQMQIAKKDDAGYIGAIQIGNITVSGEKFIELMELPSCAFKIHASGNSLIFDVRGEGNGVGLSLNGANELAKQGMLYEDIIHHYYSNVTIQSYEVQN